jgi:DNA-binding NtrC family response regulator
MCAGEEVRAEDLPKSMRSPKAEAPPKTEAPRSLSELREQWLAPHERQYVSQLLDACGGRVDDAARKAGVNRVTFYRLMSKHGLKLQRRAAQA